MSVNDNIASFQQSSILKQISDCGRMVKVRCADSELLENDVVLILMLYHSFNQVGLDLRPDSLVLLPDYDTDFFLKLKSELLSSAKTIRSIFLPEDFKLPNDDVKPPQMTPTHFKPMDVGFEGKEKVNDLSTVVLEFNGNGLFADLDLEEGSFKCDKCESVLKSKKSLMAHVKYKHEGVRFPCSECSETFTSNHSLKVHKKSIHEGVKYSCSECDNVYSTTGHLRVHKLSKHSGIVLDCDQCSYQTSSQRALKEHIKSHLVANYFCDQCEFRTALERKLKLHIQTKHDPSQNPINPTEGICELCGFVAVNKSELTKHKRVKHQELKYQCDQCLFRTGGEKSLQKHKQNNHA